MKKRGGKSPSQRQLRVGEELRHVLAECLGRGELRDPDLQDRTITITQVEVSPDLRNATAFFVPLGGEHSPEILAALRRSSGYLRTVIGRSVELRSVPNLAFELDQSFDRAARIEALLHRPDVAADLADPAEDGLPEDVPPAGRS